MQTFTSKCVLKSNILKKTQLFQGVLLPFSPLFLRNFQFRNITQKFFLIHENSPGMMKHLIWLTPLWRSIHFHKRSFTFHLTSQQICIPTYSSSAPPGFIPSTKVLPSHFNWPQPPFKKPSLGQVDICSFAVGFSSISPFTVKTQLQVNKRYQPAHTEACDSCK